MCMIEGADDFCQVLDECDRKARSAHKCNECRRLIGPGEIYLLEKLLFDGAVHTHKTCAHCRVVRDWLSDECGGWVYSEVEEDFREHLYSNGVGGDTGYGYTVARLAVGMAWYWRTPRGRLMPVPEMPLTTHELLPKLTHRNGPTTS